MAYLYPYGDTQQLNLDWLIEQWNEVKSQIDGSLQAEIDRVEAAISDLLTARDEAVAAQTAAQASAQAAAGSASTASGAASTATAQAQAAAGSAATAGAHASDAQGYAATAQQAAQAANNSAGAAANSANTANGAKQDAQMYAQQASGSAQNAQGSAVAAQQQFTLADAARQAAQGAASDAADSAQEAQDVLDSIPEDYSELSEDVSELKTAITQLDASLSGEITRATTAENLKVNKPITSPNGTNGQILRTLGNGNTEWVSVGLPTDAQTAEAVSDWLDAHPEATTTVQDHSLTYEKFVNGTLGYVTPEMYGAKGDGITDDTNALRACIVDNNYVLLKGTYLITAPLYFSNKNNITFYGGKITRPINETFNTIAGDGHCDNIRFECIEFDGNGNDSETSYTWPNAAQACIKLASQCKNIFVEKCKILNHNYGVCILGADELNQPVSFDNTAYNGVIRDCVFYNCTASIDTYGKSTLIDHNLFYATTDGAVRLEANLLSAGADNPMTDTNYYQSNVGTVVCNNLFLDTLGWDINTYHNMYGCDIHSNTHINFEKGVSANNYDYDSCVNIHDNAYIYQKPQTIDENKRPSLYDPVAFLYGKTVSFHNNNMYMPIVGIYGRGCATVYDNNIDKPIISGIAHYDSSGASGKTIYSGNVITGHEVAEGAWYGCQAIYLGDTSHTEVHINDTIIDSTVRPILAASGTTAFIKNLISNVECLQITKPSGEYEYSN